MSSLSFLSVYLAAASLIVLMTAVSAQYDDFTPAPDYDDYNATFEYTFFSNTSSDALDKLSEQFIGLDDEDDEGDEDGGKVGIGSAASLPVSMDIRMPVWTLVVLISLNTL